MQSYPSEHREIVSALVDGRFVIYPNPTFVSLKLQEEEYREFFMQSYGYELVIDSEIAYLTSTEGMEKRTRDFVLFLALLCRELDYSGKNFRDAIEVGVFDMAETEEMLRQSSKWEVLEKTSVADFNEFISIWHRKNVLFRAEGQFRFTKAVKVFFDFAVNVANAKLKEAEEA